MTACRLTPTWQSDFFPSVPHHCRAAPADRSPALGKEVSSITRASGQIAAVTFAATARSTGTWSHVDWLTNGCNACMLPSGSRSAIGWIDFRRPSSISPRR